MGLHNVVIYANHTLGNMGTSETSTFTIAASEPLPIVSVLTASSIAFIVVGAGLLVYFEKRKRLAEKVFCAYA